MSTKAFTDLLNAPADEEIKLPVAPVGSWRLTIKGHKLYAAKDEDTAGRLMYILVPTEAQEDVDASEVSDMGDQIEEVSIPYTFWLRDKKDMKKLQKFLKNVGAELSGRSLLEAAQSVDGYEVIAFVDQEPDKDDPETIYNRLSQFAPVDAA